MQRNVTRRAFLRATGAVGGLALAPIAARAAEAPVILILGDSISAAYGLPPGTGWTDLLQKRLDSRKPAWRVGGAHRERREREPGCGA